MRKTILAPLALLGLIAAPAMAATTPAPKPAVQKTVKHAQVKKATHRTAAKAR